MNFVSQKISARVALCQLMKDVLNDRNVIAMDASGEAQPFRSEVNRFCF